MLDMETKTASLPVERLKMSEVSQHKDNPRRHSRQQIEQIAESIEQHGYAKGSMVAQKSSMSLVAGNGVYAALTLLDYEEADFVVVDMDDTEALQFLIRDNRLSELSAWDMPVLNANLSTLKDEGYELEDMAFTMEAMGDLKAAELRREADNRVVEEDEPPEVSEEEPVTQTGDLWALGNHALLCGDCTIPENIKRLMGGLQADMGLTSPPYAVGKQYEAGVSFPQHLDLLRGVADRSLEIIKPGGFFFVNFGEIAAQSHASPMTGSDRQCLYPISKDYWQIFHVERGMDLYAQRVWYKPFNRLQQPFWTYHTSIPHHQEWEHIWTWRLPGGDGDAVHDWDISSRAVWDTRAESTDDRPLTRHVAAFPVCLPERAMRAHTDECAVVWEPFCGSGTTLVVADQLGRICMGTELNPAYCDVIVQRYINHAGTDEDVYVERGGQRLSWKEVQDRPKVHVC